MELFYDEFEVKIAEHYVYNNSTVRKTAMAFDIPKTRVHAKLLHFIVCHDKMYNGLAKMVKELIEKNKLERHIRGGNATKQKYMQIRESKNK